MISLTFSSSGVLHPQEDRLRNTSSKKEQDQISYHRSMSGLVARFILSAVDVGGNDSIEISPTDYETQCDTTFVYTFNIVCGP